MIKNERQYKISKTKVEQFNSSLSSLQQKIVQSDDPFLKLEYDALQGQMLDLKRELQEYDDLKSGNIPILEFFSIEDLPTTLIKSRIALGLSQKDLAIKVNLQEQQIQRYEQTDYESASLSRLMEIFHALDLEKEKIELPESIPTLKHVMKKLSFIGLDSSFVTSRLIPNSLIPSTDPDQSKELLDLQATSRIGKIFGWNSEQMLGDTPLVLPPIQVKFKMPKNANTAKVHAYSLYSRYVAMLLAQATHHLNKKAIPNNPYAIRDEILSSFSVISFKNLIRYVWGFGVRVLFHLDSLL